MIHWHDKIYFGEGLKNEYKSVRASFEAGKSPWGVYVIALSSSRHEQLDICRADMFLRSCKIFSEPMVVGLALGKDEAEELVALMAFDVYEKTGGADLRGFFEQDGI